MVSRRTSSRVCPLWTATSGGPEITLAYDPGAHGVTTLSGQVIAGTITVELA